MASWVETVVHRHAAAHGAPVVHGSVDYSLISTPGELEMALRGGVDSAAGATVSPSSAMRVAAVYRCVDLRATALACLPVHVIAETATGAVGRKVPNHPLARLLGSKPNARLTSYEFRRLLGAHVLLRGNGYALKVRSGRRILELLPMHPDRVTVEELDDMSLRYHYTRKDGRTVIFPQSEVFHLRDLSTDGVVGHSKITLMREAVGVALQAERFGAKMFRNGMAVGGALKHPGRLGPQATAALRQQMEERFAGADNAHKWMVLEEGMSVEKLGMTSEDLQFIESRKFQRSEIAMFFGVPPHLIGDVEKTTSWGTGIEQQNLGFLQYTLGGDIAMWEQAIERDLVAEAEAPRIYVKLNVAGFLRAASKDRADYYAKALGSGGSQAWMTRNEIRALEDLPPVAGGDEFPAPTNVPPAPSGSGDSPSGPAEPDDDDAEDTTS